MRARHGPPRPIRIRYVFFGPSLVTSLPSFNPLLETGDSEFHRASPTPDCASQALLRYCALLCRAVLCSDFAIIFAALLQNIIYCFTSVFSTIGLEIELAAISARPRPLPGHEKPAVLHWCRPTRIWIWTSGGSGLDLAFSPGSGGSGSQPTSTGPQLTSATLIDCY